MQNSKKNNSNSGLDSRSAGLRNEKLVLSLLRRHKSLSQAQLRDLAGIQSSTASYIVRRLREKGLIIEKPGTSQKRGKKPVLLQINPLGGFVFGVEINPSYLYIGLFDFKCDLYDSIKIPIGTDHSPEYVTALLVNNLQTLINKRDINPDKVLGAGVSLSGTITHSGTVTLASPLGWKNVEFGKMLNQHLNFPVSVYTTRVRLLAEDYLLKNPPSDDKNADLQKIKLPWVSYRNVLYINVGNGVGGNIICDGQLVQGATNRSAEIGHIVIDPDGPICGCGNKGCLEAFVSGPAIAKQIQKAIQSDQQTSLENTISNTDLPEDIISKWGLAIAESDDYSIQLRDNTIKHLCWAAMISINCYDPSLVILAGYVVAQFSDELISEMEKAMPTQVYDNDSRQIQIVRARGGDQALIRGAGLAVFNQETVNA